MWLVECWQAINRQTLPHVRPPAVTKSPNFWAGTSPPPPPANKQHSFQYTVTYHIKSCMAHSGGDRGLRQKARLFVTEGIMAKKQESPDSISKASANACGVGIYFYFIHPSRAYYEQQVVPFFLLDQI